MRGETDRDVSYVCDAGLRLVGPSSLSCLANGTWSSPAPACERRPHAARARPRPRPRPPNPPLRPAGPPSGGCEAPKPVPHGRMQEHQLSTGRAVEVQCDAGYELVGEALVACVGGASWSAAFPACQRESPAQRRKVDRDGGDLTRSSRPQPSGARRPRGGGTAAAAAAEGGGRTSGWGSRSASPAPGVTRSKAAAPSPAGRTRRGASSAPCVKVGGAETPPPLPHATPPPPSCMSRGGARFRTNGGAEQTLNHAGLSCRGVLRPPPPRGQRGGAGGGVPVRGRGGILVLRRLHHGGQRKEQVPGERHLDAASHVQR